jgi:mannitol/fructose-specific phosphotransferase system IIA component (Ntr-type)
MRLRDHIRPDLVMAELDARDRDTVLDRLAEFIAARDPGVDRHELLDVLQRREEAHTTAMGQGLALPHATLPGLDRTLFGVARARSPVAFGGEPDDPVHLFFILLSPPGAEGTHIRLLARICRLVRVPGVTDDLLGAEDADGVVRALLRHDEEQV